MQNEKNTRNKIIAESKKAKPISILAEKNKKLEDKMGSMQNEKNKDNKIIAESKEVKPISILAEKIKEIEDKSVVVTEQLKNNLQTQSIPYIKSDIDEDEKRKKRQGNVQKTSTTISKRKLYNIKTSRNKEITLNRDKKKQKHKGYSFVVQGKLEGASKRRFEKQLKDLKKELKSGNLSQSAYENKRTLIQASAKKELQMDAYYLSNLTDKKIATNLNKKEMKINGYETVSYNSLRNTVTITTKDFMHRRKVQTMKLEKYIKLQNADRPMYYYGGKAATELGGMAGRKIYDGTKDRLSNNRNMESDTIRMMLDSPDTVYKGYKTGKKARDTIAKGVQTVYNIANIKSEKELRKLMLDDGGKLAAGASLKGIEFGFNKVQDSLKKNKNLESDTIHSLHSIASAPYKTIKGIKNAKNTAKFVKRTVEQMLKVAETARKVIVAAAKAAAQLTLYAISTLGLPAIMIFLAIALIMMIFMGVMGDTATNTTSNNEILEPLYTYTIELKKEYEEALEDVKENFLEENSDNQDCEYGRNDIIQNVYYCFNGDTSTYERGVSTRFIYIYSAMVMHFEGDIQAVYDSSNTEVTKEEMEEYIEKCFNYMYDKNNINIIHHEYEKIDDCLEEPVYDDDGNLLHYEHEHEYGGFDIYIDVKSGEQLLEWLITQNLLTADQKNDVYDFMAELQNLVLEETEQDIVDKGFSYATYYGDGEISIAIDKTELVALQGVELNEVTDFATNYIGYKYVYGGKNINTGIDCSGFVAFVYDHFGVTSLNGKGTSGQINEGQPVSSLSEAKPGDLIFYNHPVSHVAMYLGDNLIIHASNSAPYPQGGVKISQATYGDINCIKRIIEIE